MPQSYETLPAPESLADRLRVAVLTDIEHIKGINKAKALPAEREHCKDLEGIAKNTLLTKVQGFALELTDKDCKEDPADDCITQAVKTNLRLIKATLLGPGTAAQILEFNKRYAELAIYAIQSEDKDSPRCLTWNAQPLPGCILDRTYDQVHHQVHLLCQIINKQNEATKEEKGSLSQSYEIIADAQRTNIVAKMFNLIQSLSENDLKPDIDDDMGSRNIKEAFLSIKEKIKQPDKSSIPIETQLYGVITWLVIYHHTKSISD